MTDNTTKIPASPEAEQSVLGGALLDPTAIVRIAHLNLAPGHFHHHQHSAIWAAILDLEGRRQPVDVITVFERMKDTGQAEACGGLSYLNDLAQSVASAANIARYAAIVIEKATLRAGLDAVDQARTILLEPDGSPADKLDRAAALFSPIQQAGHKPEARRLGELIADRIDHWQGLENGDVVAGITTGLSLLNQALGGGLKGGKFIVLAARPGVGKTSLATQVAEACAGSGTPVLILSQEMPAADLADRAVANLGRVDLGALVSGRFGDEDWKRIADAADSAAELPLYVDDAPSLNLLQIKSKARLMKRRHGLGLLVVDYLQLCAGMSSRDNRNAQIEEISRGLKALAKELDITVLALAQLNRGSTQRDEPDLADLRDSGAIEQDADTVLFLHPKAELGEGAVLVAAILAKNRQGKRGRIALEFHGATQRWVESSADVSRGAKK